jgi:hypothetical protein
MLAESGTGCNGPDFCRSLNIRTNQVTVDKVIDGLYGLPPEEFTSARDLAVRELSAAPDVAERATRADTRRSAM